MSHQYSDLSIELTKLLDKKIKKEQGIFISPRSIIEKLTQAVFKYASDNGLSLQRILEPSCGTCEIINYLDKEILDSSTIIDGIELNSTIFNKILALDFIKQVNLTQCDFLKYTSAYDYDLIIGNPPYVVCNKADIPQQYNSFIVGQANLFGLFILHSLSMLKPNGILAFIIPKSFLNSCYYAKIRNYIISCCRIAEIIDFTDGSFLDTQQATFGLVLHKMVVGSSVSSNYAVKISQNYVFCVNVSLFKSILEGSTTLESLGLSVKTGSVVWNEKYKDDTKNEKSKSKNKKDLLTSDNSKTLLLYNSNVTPDNTIKLMDFKNDKKKQYILMTGSTEPIIVVNRGNGNSAYKLNYAFVSPNIVDGPYLVENHLNVIYSPVERPAEVLTALYEQIIASFKDSRSQQFIDMFCGNNALSKTELEKVFPIYL
jgi:type I restriction-modification system DNA methylase subunit